jgi:hypothetical protein
MGLWILNIHYSVHIPCYTVWNFYKTLFLHILLMALDHKVLYTNFLEQLENGCHDWLFRPPCWTLPDHPQARCLGTSERDSLSQVMWKPEHSCLSMSISASQEYRFRAYWHNSSLLNPEVAFKIGHSLVTHVKKGNSLIMMMSYIEETDMLVMNSPPISNR